MEWIIENWVFIAIAIFFIAMHYFGFGCCGGHGKHEKHGDGDEHKWHSKQGPSDRDGRL